jgi:uncharacterized protein with NAD-binding domain and iron-sulfur cluster
MVVNLIVRQVIIIGAGVAGATAALRLAERGYKVALYERDPQPGGQFRAVKSRGPVRHEHCYHLFDAWYHNFWTIIDELNLRDRFQALYGVRYVRRGDVKNMMELREVGAVESLAANVLSGVLSPADMYLFLYSYVDLLAANLDRRHYRELVSTNGFLYSRPYVTDQCARMHDNLLLKAFGVPSFEESAQSYRKFIGLHAVDPSPMFYVMKGDVHNNFWTPLCRKLKELNVEIHYGHELRRVVVDNNRRVTRLDFMLLSEFAEYRTKAGRNTHRLQHVEVQGNVVLAVPPASVAELNDRRIISIEPQFGRCAKLRTEPMVSVHLHLNERFSARLRMHGLQQLPDEPIVLLDSKFSLTVQNNSRLWPDVPKGDTYLHVVASDVRQLLAGGRAHGIIPHAESQDTSFNIYEPDTVMEFILNELRNYIPLEQEDIRADQLELDRNVKYPIFINSVGAWEYRPTTSTSISNLFFAGAHCQQAIDVVTIETAVLSGLNAAEAVRLAAGLGAPVAIRYPAEWPRYYYWPALIAAAPFAALAKVWAELYATADASGREGTEIDGAAQVPKSRSVPGGLSNCCRSMVKMYVDLARLPVDLASEFYRQTRSRSASGASGTLAAIRPARTKSRIRECHDDGPLAGSLELCCRPYIVAAQVWIDALHRLFTM